MICNRIVAAESQMGSSLPPVSIHQHHLLLQHPATKFAIPLPRLLAGNSTSTNFLSASLLLNRSRPLSPSNPKSWCGRCPATGPRPPSPPQSEPPSDNGSFSTSGLPAKLSRFQDTVQIFFAVLFWMSLFFWSSVWDRKDNGRSDKGSRFRR